MSSFITLPSPRLELRSDSPSDYEVTFTITRDESTYTTIIVLGGTTTEDPDAISTPLSTILYPTSTYIPLSPIATVYPTEQTTTPSAPPHPSNYQVVLGATLGSVLGFLVVLTLIYVCFFPKRSITWASPMSSVVSRSTKGSKKSRRSRRRRRRRRRRRWRRSTTFYSAKVTTETTPENLNDD